jgi:hypothetical protein
MLVASDKGQWEVVPIIQGRQQEWHSTVLARKESARERNGTVVTVAISAGIF